MLSVLTKILGNYGFALGAGSNCGEAERNGISALYGVGNHGQVIKDTLAHILYLACEVMAINGNRDLLGHVAYALGLGICLSLEESKLL